MVQSGQARVARVGVAEGISFSNMQALGKPEQFLPQLNNAHCTDLVVQADSVYPTHSGVTTLTLYVGYEIPSSTHCLILRMRTIELLFVTVRFQIV